MSVVLPPFALLPTALDTSSLPSPVSDPFISYAFGAEPLEETLFFGLVQDIVDAKLALLFLLDWKADEIDAPGVVGLVVLSGASEFGWKAERWDVPNAGAWWTVLSSGLLGRDQGPRVRYPPTPGFRPIFTSAAEPPYRFGLGLNPNSELSAAFQSGAYFVGEQIVPDGQKPRVTFCAPTDWRAASRWPR